MDQHSLAARQFGTRADAYLGSAVHAQGDDLARLGRVARELGATTALDLGCGAGHASYALAAGGADVVAYDLSRDMLDVVEQQARERGLSQVHVRQGSAERLPFADASFDLVASRFSAHHWPDVESGLREARRVLRPQGTLVMIDAVAPESPLHDTVLQTAELLRDPSHVRDHRVSEWIALLQRAGFAAPEVTSWTLTMEFASWVARMRTSPLRADAIRDVFAQAAQEVREHFRVGPDGSFDLTVAWMQSRPAAQR